MQISDYLGQYNNALNNGTSVAQGQAANATQTVGAKLAGLQAGSIFEGSINSIDGSRVVIGLSNGQTIPARLDAALNLILGQSMFFQVKSNDGNTIAIRPYQDNGAMNPTIRGALQAAGMEMNEETVGLVDQMMEEGLSIDRNSLHTMRQLMFQNPGTPLSVLADMTKLGIPVNSQMISQFLNYQMDQYEMLGQMDRVMDELPGVFDSEGMDTGELAKLNTQILTILEEGLPAAEGQEELFVQKEPQAGESLETNPGLQALPEQADEVAGRQAGQAGIEGQAGLTEQTRQAGQKETEVTAATENERNASFLRAVEPEQTKGQPVSALLDRPQLESLEQQLRQVFPQKEGLKLNDSLSARELLDQIARQLDQAPAPDREALGRLFSGKEYHALLKDVMQQQWTVTPQELKTEHKVEELYERLDKQMGQLENLAKQAGLQSNSLSESVAQVRNNIDFMNQINQAYTYVQIPLKLANQNAHSDLYVYTNKRNLQKKEGELSAFLHLDLEHLGSTDVSIKMLDSNVSTKFYLADDAAYDLIEQHLPRLEERLTKLGYHCSISLENQEKKMDFVEDFLKTGQPRQGVATRGKVHRYSFDVRA